MDKPVLAIIIPCYNEQELIADTIRRLLVKINNLSESEKISPLSFLYLIDDGSKDDTWDIIYKFNKEEPKVKALKLARNFGNQNAILAGLLGVHKLNPDCALTIDADLQQDENTIELFIDKYLAGVDIVCGIRNNDESDPSFFKKYSSHLFYKLMNLMGAGLTENHSDYRLVSRKVIEALSEYKEVNLFLRGIFNNIGFKKDYVHFDVRPRAVGKSKYNLASLISLALNGITSFSVVPLRMVAILGVLMALFSFVFGIEVLFEKYVYKTTVPGWTTIVLATCFIGGVQIFCTGIIGEYLGQIYKETKSRPRYIRDIELL